MQNIAFSIYSFQYDKFARVTGEAEIFISLASCSGRCLEEMNDVSAVRLMKFRHLALLGVFNENYLFLVCKCGKKIGFYR